MDLRIADKDTLDKVAIALGVSDNKIYGVRINKKDSNPFTRCEYLGDAIGKRPARMNFETGIFEYGDWADAWFIKDNFPCMLNSNGTIAYKLNPNDYKFKEDGTMSDIKGEAGSGLNAMSAIPTVWLWQYEIGDYEYIYVANYKVNENYEAFAHQRLDGTIAPYVFLGMFQGSDTESVGILRSISGQLPLVNETLDSFIIYASNNSGDNTSVTQWSIGTWSQRNLMQCLLVLISCSTDSQTAFGMGYGNSMKDYGDTTTEPIESGTLNNMGQFYGYSDLYHQVKVFHIESLWGNVNRRYLGLVKTSLNDLKVKMTPPYSIAIGDIGEWHTLEVPKEDILGTDYYPSSTKMTKYGLFPLKKGGGSSSSYLCDANSIPESSSFTYASFGGSHNTTHYRGLFAINLERSNSYKSSIIGATLSCLP